MSIYNLAPPSQQHEIYAFWKDGFSASDCQRIIQLGEKNLEVAGVGSNTVDPSIRISTVSWLTYEQAPWVYDRLGYIARQLNGQFFGFNITGFHEDLQYTVYEAQKEAKGFYDWHIDEGFAQNRPPRKLSLSLQLSAPDEYQGGDLLLSTGARGHITADKEQGFVFAFPSFYQHTVTPVVKGTRRSLVAWLTGPRFT